LAGLLETLTERQIMKSRTYTTLAATSITLAVSALVISCGGGGGGDSSSGTPTPTPVTKAATLDAASVATGIKEFAAFIPVCSRTAKSSTTVSIAPALVTRTQMLSSESGAGAAALIQGAIAASQNRMSLTAALGSTKPADQLGSCGGRMTYPAYSHLSGTTTATRSYESYCSLDSSTGQKSILNGSMSFVDTGTPSANGPITTKMEASSPAGISYVVQDAAGKTVNSQLFAFTNFVSVVGVPGGTPTAARPDTMSIAEVKITNQLTGKTYRETGFNVSSFTTASGGEQVSISGRGYRSNGDYFDVATTVPQTTDADGNTLAGTVSFTGANGSVAVATFVPGATSQATVTVNGTAVTDAPACK
jgi:hypothetical protein